VDRRRWTQDPRRRRHLPGGTPWGSAGAGIRGLDDPLGLVWLRGKLYVSSVGRVSVFGGFRGRHFSSDRTIVTGPVRHGENNGLALTPTGRFVIGITATCDHCRPKFEVFGIDRLVSPRRKRPTALRVEDQGSGRAHLLPRRERSVRLDEPA
jgi:hypothetical protein